MIIERDEGSDGWIAYEGRWNPENYEFDRLRACFKCPERGALDNGSYQEWYVNAAPIGAAPNWGTSTMRCLSKWECEWYVLCLLGLVANVSSVIVKAYDLKFFSDAMICFFCFSGQWSGTLRDLEWNNASNHASAWVYLLSQCTTVRRTDLPPGGQIMPIICQSFQMGWTAFASIQAMHVTMPHHMTWLRVIHSGSPASISDLLIWALSFVGIAEVSDSQIKVSRLSYAVIYLFFHPLQQLKSSLRYPGHWSWSILLIHSHSMEPFWTRALSLILLLWRNCWSVRFSEKWVVYRIGYLLLFFADFSTTLFFLSRV